MNQPQVMNYAEREKLKKFSQSPDCSPVLLTIVVHWMRQSLTIPFALYAANWIAAHPETPEELAKEWRLLTPRKIADGMSDWNSYGHTCSSDAHHMSAGITGHFNRGHK